MRRAANILLLVSAIMCIVLSAIFTTLGFYFSDIVNPNIRLLFLFLASFCLMNSILSFKSRNTYDRYHFVLSIVFSMLSLTFVGAVGGIFGLIKGDTVI